jgi:hypothetical protein
MAEINFRNATAVRISLTAAGLAMMFFLLTGPLLYPILPLVVGFFLAGFMATLWYGRRTGQRVSVSSGARLGWITGIFSFGMFVAIITAILVAVSTQGGLVNFYKKHMPPQDPNVEQVIKVFSDPSGAVQVMVLGLVFLFVVLTTLPMLGGVVGAKISERRV